MQHILNKYISPELILNAYYQGFFPMADEREEIGFYAFESRGVIPLDGRFTVRRSLQQVVKKKDYIVTFDRAPLEVVRACSRKGAVPSHERWLNDELIEHIMALFEMGWVHTVEVWRYTTPGAEALSLIGGLYGLTFGAAFCGESMFSNKSFGSQIALVHLVEHLRNRGFRLLDAQMPSDHLKQFGLYECKQADFLTLFHEAASIEACF